MFSRFALLAAAVLLAAPTAAHAQRGCDDYDFDDCRRGRYGSSPDNYLGGSFTVARPTGEFGEYVDSGLGGDIHYIRALDDDGVVALRVDAGLAIYGYERYTAGDDWGYYTDVSTSNNIAWIGVGPQIGVPDGRLRPYVNGYAGYTFLWTTTTLDDGYDDYYYGDPYHDDEVTITEQDDWSFSYGAGAGVYIPLRQGGRNPLSIDLGLRYHNNGEAEYLREGDIIGNPDGTVSIFPVRSDTDLMTYHIGFSIGVGR